MARSWIRVLAAVLAVGCGDDDGDGGGGGTADASVPVEDGGPAGADGGGVEPDAPSGLGQFCATNAVDGGPGSCPSGTVCCNKGTTICTLPEDCSGGPGYVQCNHTPDCPGGRICCAVSGMTFCTKPSTCTQYGGTEVP